MKYSLAALKLTAFDISKTTSRLFKCIALFILASQFIGCASIFDSSASKAKSKDKKKEGWSLFKKKEYQEPRSFVATWTEDTLIHPGKPITRGFGGRLYFYNDRSQTIPVEGELVVYGFDDSSNPDTKNIHHTVSTSPSPSDQNVNAAEKRFRFTAEQFTQHFSQSDLGASYSVWIPWDAVGGPQRKITLIPCFITKEGRTVRGEATKLVLSGKPTVVTNSDTTGNPIQLASANQPVNDPRQAMASLLNDPLRGSNSTQTSVANSGMQPLGLNTTTIRVGHSTTLGTPGLSQNSSINSNYLPNSMYAPNSQQGLPGAQGYAANGLSPLNAQQSAQMNSQMNSSFNPAFNAQFNSPVPQQMNPQLNAQPFNTQQINTLPSPQQYSQQLNPSTSQSLANPPSMGSPSTSNFHNPLSQTALPPAGHNLPPTGWIGR